MCKRGVAVVFQGLRTGRGRIRAKLLPKGAVGFMRAGVFARTCVCGTHVPVHEPTQARTTPVHEPLAWVRAQVCLGPKVSCVDREVEALEFGVWV